ncbi:MAG: thioredoxin family protein [Phycisphaeraceae bacterium]|nr:thioredoxin family protein [Phycisphaeraceae bacterium]
MAQKLKPGEKAPDFTLPDIAGGKISLADRLPGAAATVVLFICNHCPYVQAYIPRLIALEKELGSAGGAARPAAQLLAICSNDATTYPQDSFDNMKKYAASWGLIFPYLRDEDQAVARAYGAERTPEVFVLDDKGICRYEGGIDDNYQDISRVTRRPLRDAIVALSRGQSVAEPKTYAIGCSIKWKSA